MTGPLTILQDPVAIAIVVTAVTYALATWTSHRDAAAMQRDGLSGVAWAAITGLAALWIIFRGGDRDAGDEAAQHVEVTQDR